MFRREFIPLIGGGICVFCLIIAYGAVGSIRTVFRILAFGSTLAGFMTGVVLLFEKVRGIHVIVGTILSGLVPALFVYIIIYISIFGYHG